MARALAVMGADVVGARVFTSAGGQALDVFYLQDAAGEPFGRRHKPALEQVCRALEAAARGEPVHGERSLGGLHRRGGAFDITPTVAVDNEGTKGSTIVEVSGRDRPGLLADLARTLADAGLSIRSAHIDSYGERAVDAFYVRDEASGKRWPDGRRLDALRDALTAVLAPPEAERGRPKLARVEARAAR
jgi:[protein-PII] uridylyltransferase